MIRHYLDSVEVKPPSNWRKIGLNFSFTNGNNMIGLRSETFIFVNDRAREIKARADANAFYGDTYDIVFEDDDTGEFITINGQLDYSKVEVFGNEVHIPFQQIFSEEWLVEQADAFSFEYLHSLGKLNDTMNIKYLVSPKSKAIDKAMLALSVYMIANELETVSGKIEKAIEDIGVAVLPLIGLGTGGITTTYDSNSMLRTVIDLALNIAYFIALGIILNKLGGELIDAFLPRWRYFKAMKERALLEAGLEQMNLTLDSSFLRDDIAFLPTKSDGNSNIIDYERLLDIGSIEEEKAYLGVDDNIKTFGDFIRQLKICYNADYRIVDGVFYFERIDYWRKGGTYVMPTVLTNQTKFTDVFKYNSDESTANTLIKMQRDLLDEYTYDNVEQGVTQITNSLSGVSNQKLVNLRGLSEVNIGFALGKYQSGYTPIQIGVVAFLQSLKKLLSIVGAGAGLKIPEYDGVLVISGYNTSAPKMLVVNDDGSLKPEQINTRYFFDNYLYINNFAKINGVHNQFKLFTSDKVPFKIKNLIELNKNNNGERDGENIEVTEFEFNDSEGKATVKHRLSYEYAKNIEVTIL